MENEIDQTIITRIKNRIQSDIYDLVKKKAIDLTDTHFTSIVMEHLEKGNHAEDIATTPEILQLNKQRLEKEDSVFITEKHADWIPSLLYNRTNFTPHGVNQINTYFQTMKEKTWSDLQSNPNTITPIIKINQTKCIKEATKYNSEQYNPQICKDINITIKNMPKKLRTLTYYPADYGIGLD